jgi:hypothetical protein
VEGINPIGEVPFRTFLSDILDLKLAGFITDSGVARGE